MILRWLAGCRTDEERDIRSFTVVTDEHLRADVLMSKLVGKACRRCPLTDEFVGCARFTASTAEEMIVFSRGSAGILWQPDLLCPPTTSLFSSSVSLI